MEAAIDPGELGPTQGRLEAITNTWLFDALVRGVFVAWFFYLVYAKVTYLIGYFEQHGSVLDATFITTVLSRMAVTVVLATMAALVLIRLRPVKKSQGFAPRLAAFLGTFIMMSLPLFPANEVSIAGNIISTLLVLAGSALSAYIVFWLGRSFSLMPEARRLVTGGPYAIARHPLYVAEEICMIGIYLPYASVGTTALLILHAYLQIKRMGYEEQVLRQAFPDYDDYARHTRRLIPGIY